ncbi:hypothetical protein Plhal304r1_c026g0086851 [Plasmopara halstedii]
MEICVANDYSAVAHVCRGDYLVAGADPLVFICDQDIFVIGLMKTLLCCCAERASTPVSEVTSAGRLDTDSDRPDRQSLRSLCRVRHVSMSSIDACFDAKTGFNNGWVRRQGRLDYLHQFEVGPATMFPNTNGGRFLGDWRQKR